MGDKSITKVSAKTAPHGDMGQKYLASGIGISMRLWEVAKGEKTKAATRDYETVGYVVAGRAELDLEGQTVHLEPGDSWVVPKGSKHTYRFTEAFTAVEATHPPAEVHGRDKAR
jgi:quercetin dioxygenase-like cupin family protein